MAERTAAEWLVEADRMAANARVAMHSPNELILATAQVAATCAVAQAVIELNKAIGRQLKEVGT